MSQNALRLPYYVRPYRVVVQDVLHPRPIMYNLKQEPYGNYSTQGPKQWGFRAQIPLTS